jgi:hypothetical protein
MRDPPNWRGDVVVARRSVMRPNGESGRGTGVARVAGAGFRHRCAESGVVVRGPADAAGQALPLVRRSGTGRREPVAGA